MSENKNHGTCPTNFTAGDLGFLAAATKDKGLQAALLAAAATAVTGNSKLKMLVSMEADMADIAAGVVGGAVAYKSLDTLGQRLEFVAESGTARVLIVAAGVVIGILVKRGGEAYVLPMVGLGRCKGWDSKADPMTVQGELYACGVQTLQGSAGAGKAAEVQAKAANG